MSAAPAALPLPAAAVIVVGVTALALPRSPGGHETLPAVLVGGELRIDPLPPSVRERLGR